jgi:hypothetical protein
MTACGGFCLGGKFSFPPALVTAAGYEEVSMKRLTGAALGALLVATSSIAALAAGTTSNTSNSPQTAARNPTTGTGGMAQSNMSGSRAGQMRAAHRDEIGDRLTDALNLLVANGYTNIQRIEPQGGQIVAVATRNGRNVTVAVDPQTHQIADRG